jgi:hypothetical protein
MSHLFVVRDQKNLAALAPALLRSRTSAGLREAALEAIRRANPGVDFDDLAPGTVVLVPPVEGTKDAGKDDPVRPAVQDLAARLRDGVGAIVASAELSEEERLAEKKGVQDLLGSSVVKRLAADVSELAENIESVRATFKEDDQSAKKQLSEVRRSQEAWAEDLDTLDSLF